MCLLLLFSCLCFKKMALNIASLYFVDNIYICVCMCLVCFILRCNVSSVLYAGLHVLICVQHTSMKKHSCEIDG